MNNFTEVTFYCRASVNHFFISGVVLCCVVLCCIVSAQEAPGPPTDGQHVYSRLYFLVLFGVLLLR